jgi:hypothetical protein
MTSSADQPLVASSPWAVPRRITRAFTRAASRRGSSCPVDVLGTVVSSIPLVLAPIAPRAATRFSGWRIVALAAFALGMSGPGQTAGVSVFVDPMMTSLDLTRSQVSTAHLVGTLGGGRWRCRVSAG